MYPLWRIPHLEPVPAWMTIAEQAAVEPDSKKLMVLIEELCDALDAASSNIIERERRCQR
jgi:hypothetical protein